MTYLNTLPGFQTLQRIFSNAGFDFDIDLSNSPLVMKGGKYFEYDELPIDLKVALDAFNDMDNF